jgi:hypothetical protein
VLLLLPLFFILPAEARENTDIGISLSRTCIIMIQNNIDSDCPTYEEILLLFPDTSRQEISGGFIEDDNGFYHREQTKFKSHFGFYTYEPNTIWVDPPGDITGKIATIFIEPSLNDYLIKGSHSMSNNTITMGHSRWVDDKCYRATISAEDWIFLIGDTIQYLDHSCDEKFTNFDHLKTISFEKSYQDITTSYKYQFDKWIELSKVKCRERCFEY